jgi:putative membrane protein
MKVGIALVLSVLAACTSRGSEAAPADTTGRRDSIAAVAAASMREEHVFGLLKHVHASDSAVGALGASQGSVLAVKDFGRMIIREHHALHRDAAKAAEELGIVPQTPTVAADEPPPILRARLNAGSPSAGWDRAYMEYAIAVHESAMENTARALAASTRPETKALITKSIPILQKHLDKAQAMRKAMSRLSDTTKTPAPTRAPATTKAPDTTKAKP